MNEYKSQVTSYFIKHFLFTAVIFFGIVFLVADYEAERILSIMVQALFWLEVLAC